MKSLRLNKEIRSSILNNIMGKWGDSNPRPDSYEDVEPDEYLANKLADEYIRENGLRGVPEKFLLQASLIKVRFPNGSLKYLYYGMDTGELIHRPTSGDSGVTPINGDSIAYQNYKELEASKKDYDNRYDKWLELRGKYKGQVSQVLQGVNTTQQLIEVWPEVEAYLPDTLHSPSNIQLPSVAISELNKQL